MDFREIEAEALAQVRAELEVRCATPLEFGEYIAWGVFRFGRTDDLSPVHRVGVPVKNQPYTTCGEVIPAPVAWMTLSPNLIRSMDACRFCDAEYVRAVKEHAA